MWWKDGLEFMKRTRAGLNKRITTLGGVALVASSTLCQSPEFRNLEETGSISRLYNLANVLGVAHPSALQISAREAPFARAADADMPLVEWALIP